MMRTKTLLTLLLFCIPGISMAQDHQPGENPIFRDRFTADPATMVYNDTMYLYVGHDEATGDQMFNINEWLVYSSTDMKNWTEHGAAMQALDFDWSQGNAWASQVIEKDGKFWFYTTTIDVNTEGDAIGVAVSDSPTGPFKDAIGGPLVVDSMTPTPEDPHDWDDIDPTAFTDDDGTTWISWGNNHLYLAKLKDNMTEIDGQIQELYLPNFTEGPWLHKREETYYLSYACFAHQNMWEKLCYATASDITGPWSYQGIIMDRNERSYTIHPAITEFKDQWYLFYHTGQLNIGDLTGDIGRRAVSAEYLFYNEDGTIKPLEKTKKGVSEPPNPPEEYQGPVFNLEGPLVDVPTDLEITQNDESREVWPGSPVITTHTEPYNEFTEPHSFNSAEGVSSLGQTIKVTDDFTLDRITLYAGDGFGTIEENPVTLALYDLGTEEVDSTYAAGENLLGSEDGLRINYKPQGLGFLSMDLPEDRQPELKAGHTYVIELKGVAGTASVFWRSSDDDSYSEGAAYLGRSLMKQNGQSRDFGVALYGN
tara:strand:- start:62899 stop:64509 length:1611 start_codon:yes stop_codon:yes gene_type:complete